ncbi:MAG: TetR/AcrR family transcriptional regulator [Planctomycetales bacterium]|nr:TetR/AcrR family transcriptional regulator [Planctomycetales bacterium]
MRDLILERGYGGTSVDVICERCGVSKGSFFHHFCSKEEAAQESLKFWMASMKAKAAESGYAEATDPVQRLMLYLDWFAQFIGSPDAPPGCLLGTLALELSDTHEAIRTIASQCFAGWIGELANMIQAAMGDDEPARSRELAEHFVSSLEGGLLLAKTREDKSVVARNVVHFRHYLESLLGAT